MRRVALLTLLLIMGGCSTVDARSYNYCQSMTTGRFITREAAAADYQHSRCVPALPAPVVVIPPPPPPPDWLVVKWAEGNCSVWFGNTLPLSPGWTAPAKGKSQTEAWVKLQALYSRGVCK